MERPPNSFTPQREDVLLSLLQSIQRDVKVLLTRNQLDGEMVLNVDDALRVMNISRRQLYRLISAEILTGFKIGRRRYFLMSEVQAVLRDSEKLKTILIQ